MTAMQIKQQHVKPWVFAGLLGSANGAVLAADDLIRTWPLFLSKVMGVRPEITVPTQLKIDASVVFTTPAAQSLTLVNASSLYMTELQKVASAIQHVEQKDKAQAAWELIDNLRNSVLTSLRSPALKAQFEERYPLDSLDALMKKMGRDSGLEADVARAKIVAMLSNPREACFATGTKVWTDKGLVSIELLKVGDMVLSQDEATGVRAYKPITRTFVHHNQPILQLRCITESDDQDRLYLTPNHPVWMVDHGWINAEDLACWDEVTLAEGSRGWINRTLKACRWVKEPKESWPKDFWLYDASGDNSWPADMPGVVNGLSSFYGSVECKDEEKVPYETDVFNIEVEEFHTYFVGSLGLWVHNKNPIEVKLFNGKGALPPADTEKGPGSN